MTEKPPTPDDPGISAAAQLLRRIHPTWIVPDQQGGRKLSRQAYQDQKSEHGTAAMSVFVEQRLEELGLSAADILSDHDGYGLAAFPASAVRSCGLTVVSAPNEADGLRGLAHALVLGEKTGSRRKALVSASTIRVWPGETLSRG